MRVAFLLSVALLAAEPVSFYRDIAPVLAFHCNRCHGDEGTAGDLDTRTYAALLRSTNLALLLELLEGKRGESRRMPREAPPLDAAAIGIFRQWIEQGAPEDRDTTSKKSWQWALRWRSAFRIECETKELAYVAAEVLNREGSLLHRVAAPVTGRQVWELRWASIWPRQVRVAVTVYYKPEGAQVAIFPPP